MQRCWLIVLVCCGLILSLAPARSERLVVSLSSHRVLSQLQLHRGRSRFVWDR